MSASLPDAVLAFLRAQGLARADEVPAAESLPGGVSSDIWRVSLRGRDICVKRALARLRVAQVWEAPVERNRYEWRWMEAAAAAVPGAAPKVLAHDEAGFFAMEFLGSLPLWKNELRDGRVDADFAGRVGAALAAIHAATAGRDAVAQAFATDANFHAIRLEPYLLATARVQPAHAAALHALARRTAATRLALVHGDVSPKNILVGPSGPVFLDAECAWYGDPAFDLAFCLNHLLLKCLWRPQHADAYLASFDALRVAYAAGVRWEPAAAVEGRAASLLPALLLARVEGKSPVEYLEREEHKGRVREVAGALLRDAPTTLTQVRQAWQPS
ncbi:MAG: aminoglycoside phosphotransferase family protein [Betaproteobacteria bacterium]|nr:aminoglycoside phosphotransferase family protein [Betaproteobacteria bacterium]